MSGIGIVELAPDGAEVRRLLEVAGDTALAAVAGRLERLFVLRSPWAPGLCFIGGLARPPGWRTAFSLAGGGTTPAAALVSCLGEAAERLSQIERPGDVAISAPFETVRTNVPPTATTMIAGLLAGSGSQTERLDWVPARDLSGAGWLLPADWCLRRRRYGPLAIPDAAPSTGCAAGRTGADAAAAALLELVERDAATRWWIDGLPPRAVALDGPGLADSRRTLKALRAASTVRQTLLLDMTTGPGLPAIAAVSFDAAGGAFAAGLAARPDVDAAARAALIELCQMEVGLQLALLKQRRLGPPGLTAEDQRHIERAAGVTADDRRLRVQGTTQPDGGPVTPGGVATILAGAGTDVFLVDLARSDLQVPVVKAVAPGLRPLPRGPSSGAAVALA